MQCRYRPGPGYPQCCCTLSALAIKKDDKEVQPLRHQLPFSDCSFISARRRPAWCVCRLWWCWRPTRAQPQPSLRACIKTVFSSFQLRICSRYLMQHPQFRPPVKRELHYFDTLLDRHSNTSLTRPSKHLHDALRSYVARFPAVTEASDTSTSLTAEVSSTYLSVRASIMNNSIHNHRFDRSPLAPLPASGSTCLRPALCSCCPTPPTEPTWTTLHR